jgi:CspA family cold shock protein
MCVYNNQIVWNLLHSHVAVGDSLGAHMAEFRGAVRWFNNAKGYGFLGREGGPDVFCHYSAIETDGYKTLKEGEPVEFDIVEGTTGRPEARGVTPLGVVGAK